MREALAGGLAGPAAMLLGALAGVGLFAVTVGSEKRPRRPVSWLRLRLREMHLRRPGTSATQNLTETLVKVLLAAALAFGSWSATGWVAAAVLGLAAGWIAPKMYQAPRQRQRMTDGIEAYSQWTEQIRDLVGASGSLFEAVTLSASNAPEPLRPAVTQMTGIARARGFPAALDWFAEEMKSPYADRLVLGMRIAWDSGARVTEAFESTARSMRAEVGMRRRNEVANSRAWTQVLAILAVTLVSVGFMFIFNRGFFDPFGTPVGQLILLAVGALIFGNVIWVLKLSESGVPIRLLTSRGHPARPADAVGAAAHGEDP